MKKSSLLMAVLSAVLAAGCVSFQYEGEALPPVEQAKFYSSPTQLSEPYQVLGTAVASGAYQEVSIDRLKDRLLEEAARRGADAVLLLSNQVVRGGSSLEEPGLRLAYTATGGTDSGNLNQVSRDFDAGGYGQVNFSGEPQPPVGSVTNYRRVLKVQFIRLEVKP